MQKIVVASKNPVKLQAVETAFRRMFPQESFTVRGESVSSGVPDQPANDAETLRGAGNRARNAQAAYPEADYWVGLEGGIALDGDDMQTFAWVVIRGKDGRQGKGRTGALFLPPAVARLVQAGKELGEADDIVFGKTNSKQANGATGLLTGDIITRADSYCSAVVLALIPFNHPDLYPIAPVEDAATTT